MTEQSKAKTLIEEARELLSKATPRPWEARLGSGNNVCTALASDNPRAFDEFVCDVLPDYALETTKAHPSRWEANRNLIARAPDLLSQLCDELDQQVSLNKTQAESITEFQREQKVFRDALRDAKEVIKVWHGPDAWDIYDQHSPEMIRINAALEAKGEQS